MFDDMQFAEEVAREYGFRSAYEHESLQQYHAELDKHLQSCLHLRLQAVSEEQQGMN